MKKNPYINLDSINKDKKSEVSAVKNTPMSFEEKYDDALEKAGIKKGEKSDYQKDMDQYSGSIKAGMEASRKRNLEMAERRKAGMPEPKSDTKASKSGYAETETKEGKKSEKPKNKGKGQKNRPSTMDEKAPNFEKRNSSTSEKDKKKGGSGEATITPKKPAETPKGGYEPENQDVKGSRSIQEKMNDFKAKGSLKIGEGISTDELYSRQKGKSNLNLKGYKYDSLTIGDIANKAARGLNKRRNESRRKIKDPQ